jgi:hypothetical protein
MKKLIVLLALLFTMGFSVSRINADVVVDETPTEEVETPVTNGPTQEEIDEFTNEVSEIIGMVFAYVGGTAGLGALLAFVLRFIKDKGIFNALKGEIAALRAENATVVQSNNNVVNTVLNMVNTEDSLVKALTGLISIANVNPATKLAILDAIKDGKVTPEEMKHIAEVAAKEVVVNEAASQTKSLIEQLASKK